MLGLGGVALIFKLVSLYRLESEWERSTGSGSWWSCHWVMKLTINSPFVICYRLDALYNEHEFNENFTYQYNGYLLFDSQS